MSQHILAVDDEPHILKLLERIVEEKTPYKITTTANSLEVPRILEEREFDVVVTDLMMPGIDGLAILRFLRGRRERVIIITAFGTLDSAMEALSAGAFDYILKPFKKEEFLFSIHRAMRSTDEWRELGNLRAIFEVDDYEQAREAFDREYVKRLHDRASGDMNALIERSGFDRNRLEELLKA